MTTDVIKTVVDALPEVYQPIYGHQELSGDVSRACEDRLTIIKGVADAVSRKLGRPLRILDIGCAQGFISLNLAAMGHAVTGIDFLTQNIDVCKALSDENPDLSVSFEQADLEAFIPEIKINTFDLVLCLSVIHHVAHKNSFEFARDLIRQLSEKIPVGIFELALKEEPLYWNDNLPENYREILFDYNYTYRLSFMPTHLSEINRPLVYASRQYAYLPGTEELPEICTRIVSAKRNPHDVAEDIYHGTRRYYLTEDDLFIKHTILQVPEYPEMEEANGKESKNEASILSHFAGDDRFPILIRFDERTDESHLVRKAFDGILLSEVIINQRQYDPQKTVSELLDFCAFLEENGLYHSDLRVWNMLLTPEGDVRVIDYGAISDEYTDVLSPYDPVISLLVTVWEIYNRKIKSVYGDRSLNVRSMIASLGNQSFYDELMQMDMNTYPFAKIKNIFENNVIFLSTSDDSSQLFSDTIDKAFYRSLEDFSNSSFCRIDNLENENLARHNETISLNNWIKGLEQENLSRIEDTKRLIEQIERIYKDLQEAEKHVAELTEKLVAQEAQVIRLDNEKRALENALVNDRANFEWRISELENSKPRRFYVKMCSGARKILRKKENDNKKKEMTFQSKPAMDQKPIYQNLDNMIDAFRDEVMDIQDLDGLLHEASSDLMSRMRIEIYREAQSLTGTGGRLHRNDKKKNLSSGWSSPGKVARRIDWRLKKNRLYRNFVRPPLHRVYKKIKIRPLNVDYMYSLEEEAFVKEIYRVFLGREPREGELEYRVVMLKEGKCRRKDLIYEFNNSPENNNTRNIKGRHYDKEEQ